MRDYSSTKWLDEIHAEGVEVKKSCCYFCHQNCGVLAYVKDGKLIYAEGDPDHPTNAGGLCTRGNQAYTFVDNPSRINYPMKRAGEKGENKWERVSWDQALTEIAAKINQIKEESGAEAVAAAAGTLRTDDWARRRFLNLFGTPNGFHNALLCWIPTFMVETAINGWSPFETDLGASKCVILWGFNPGASSMPGHARLHRPAARKWPEAHRRRPALLRDRRARGSLAAAASGFRHGPVHGHDQRHHERVIL